MLVDDDFDLSRFGYQHNNLLGMRFSSNDSEHESHITMDSVGVILLHYF